MRKTLLALLLIIISVPISGSATLPVCYRSSTASIVSSSGGVGAVTVTWSVSAEFATGSQTVQALGYGVDAFYHPCPCGSGTDKAKSCLGEATKGCPSEIYQEDGCTQASISWSIINGTVTIDSFPCAGEACLGTNATCGYGGTATTVTLSHTCC